MKNNQVYLDQLLDRQRIIRVQIDEPSLFPHNDPNYNPIETISNTGFSLTARELIQAIGCKTGCVPSSDLDSCLDNAYKYIHLFDLENSNLRFKIVPDGDLRTALSQEFGIGMTCLIASKCFGIDWDQIGSIPGAGTRADFRATSNDTRYIFESKGTLYSDNQTGQIIKGISQKNEHRKKKERIDVGLVVSTFISKDNDDPLIRIADPKMYSESIFFSPESKLFFRYRHFIRILQYIGDTPLAKILYWTSFNILRGELIPKRLPISFPPEYPAYLHTINIDGESYIGRWFDTLVLKGPNRYKHLLNWKLPQPLLKYPGTRIRVFQGILKSHYDLLLNLQLDKIKIVSGDQLSFRKRTKDDLPASVFPDGSVLLVEAFE